MTKNDSFRFKKILSSLDLILLTGGASLILGLLSFSGMYALYPVLSWAYATFILSSAYEGQIYSENIKKAFQKLFRKGNLEHHVAKQYLLAHFPTETEDADCPQFFKDYKAQLLLLTTYLHRELSEADQNKKERIFNTLQDMEYWFAHQLIHKPKETSAYAKSLQKWLQKEETAQKAAQERYKTLQYRLYFAKGFSLISAFFMGLSSTYLLVEAFEIIPFFAAIPFAFWPMLIIPMSLIAGRAYYYLIYNTVDDLVKNETIKALYQNLREDIKQGWNARTVFMTGMATFLVSLALALTVCTAGTWWTIATQGRPVFDWMKRLPSAIMGIVNPLISGLSAIFFNLLNTAESLELFYAAIRPQENSKTSIKAPAEQPQQSNAMTQVWTHLQATENIWQQLNPFRILLKLTITPLRALLFLGHLGSIALTANRMPGLSQIVSSLIALISEGFEDAHYFLDTHTHTATDNHEQCSYHLLEGKMYIEHAEFQTILAAHCQEESGHTHQDDIPTRLLNGLASPLYLLATLWDVWASQNNASSDSPKRVLSFTQAWNKQRGIPEKEQVPVSFMGSPSMHWQKEQALFLIERHAQQLAMASTGNDLAKEKIEQLHALQDNIRKKKPQALALQLKNQAKVEVYGKHRFFNVGEVTETERFIAELPERIALRVPAA